MAMLQSAHWPVLIDVYFFLGGLAGGAFVIATAALLVDAVRYRDVVRVGYYLAFVALVPSARPLWINAHVLGALFLAVGASSGAAAMALVLAVLRGRNRDGVARLGTTIVLALLIQLLAVIGFVWSVQASGSSQALKALALITSGPYSTLFWGGAIVVGSVVPLLLGLLGLKRPSVGLTAVVSVLVLVGGFLVKTLS